MTCSHSALPVTDDLAIAIRAYVAYSDEVGRVFRPEVGHRADVKRATYSDAKRAIWDAPAWVVGDILSNGSEGQASSAGAHRLRRLSPARSMRYAL